MLMLMSQCKPSFSVRASYKVLKQLIQSEIEEVEFHKSKRVNESERVTIKATRDRGVQFPTQERDVNKAMKTLYDTALYLRKCINQSKKWEFKRSLPPRTILLFQIGNQWAQHYSFVEEKEQ